MYYYCSVAIRDPLLDMTYTIYNYAVTVRTITDEPEENTAISPEFRINTHTSGERWSDVIVTKAQGLIEVEGPRIDIGPH